MFAPNETIAAQATAPGKGGIAIVRVSGPGVSDVMKTVLGCQLPPRQATHLAFRGDENDVLDEGIAVFFQAPNSFTGEDVLELHGHGGPVVVDMLLQRILGLGVRLARPGEFSERAFLNDKIDLAQAEAIADLIDASSTQAAKLALRSLQGDFSKAIHSLNEKITHLRMYIEAAIDFAEEEIDFLSDSKLTTQLTVILSDLNLIESNAKQGSVLREGITVVIAGEPNVGKSSLLNALSGKALAIVTDVPGTTRDVLRDQILLDGIPVHIIDTAGLRDSDDVVEKEGIRRAQQEIEKADVILYVSDATKPAATDHCDQFILSEKTPLIVYLNNKIDLTNDRAEIKQIDGKTAIALSAKTGAGFDLLRSHIKSIAGIHQEEGLYLARRRHLDALARARLYLETGFNQLSTTRSGELAAEDLRLAHQSLSEITGEFTADDLLGRIFSSFCVGK